jgi:hypothetical protein
MTTHHDDGSVNVRRRPARAIAAAAAALLAAGARPGAAADPAPAPGNVYVYDVSRFRATDPALLVARTNGTFALTLPAPAGLAARPAGGLVVVGDGRAEFLAPDGAAAGGFEIEGAGRAVACDPEGRIYVGLRDRVLVFDAEGRELAEWARLGERSAVTSLAVGGGEVAIADAGERAVWFFSREGRLLRRVDGPGTADRDVPGFLIPSPHFDVVADPDGSWWVVNPGHQRIERYGADGRFAGAWGQASVRIDGFGGCCNPTDIARLPDGAFVTSEKGIPRVKIHGADGAFLGVVAGAEAFDEDVVGLDLAVDAGGRIFVLDPKRRQVRAFVRTKARAADAATAGEAAP